MSSFVDLIDYLTREINPSLLHTIIDIDGKRSIEFKELKNPHETVLKKIIITGFKDVVAINHDNISICNPLLFSSIREAKKTCDGIVFCVVDNEPYIIVFDMKSSLSNKKEHIWKTKSGKNFLSYMSCVLEQFSNKSLSNWKVCYCIFHAGAPKRETGIELKVSYQPDSPVYHCVENGDAIPLRKIIGKPL